MNIANNFSDDTFTALLDSDIKTWLLGKVKKIDRGYYPKYILRSLAKKGYFNNNITTTGLLKDTIPAHDREAEIKQGNFSGFLIQALQSISAVSSICGTTGFCLWCQQALSWYLANSQNVTLRENILAAIHAGYMLGGTGLSNPIKSYANIENNSLKASINDKGYTIKGTLPWVSNLEYGHIFAAIFPVIHDTKISSFVMGLIRCEEEKGIMLGDNISFSGLDGSATKSVRIKNYFMPHDDCLANPAESLLIKITAGFIILQMGMAMGIISSCLNQIHKANLTHAYINKFLNIDQEELIHSYHTLSDKAFCLAKTPYQSNDKNYMIDVLSTRLAFSKLALKASNAACLFAGAKGYMRDSAVERLLRESYFIAMVTPSIKHLQKELYDISQGKGVMKQWHTNLASRSNT
ncbi:acyl-CoA dehydrogenase [Helicobacter aurati]|uniref:Acyl-CoA dehydrogenase n=1 Tax=Helicobacter aurati TaxID=137778 RepID=A0A3D8J7A6_9HELI|nr:acyl-CoA dehydrogenase [Helicobacter aurati]RDU73369.1 acyl-CoA dehydrogenase [Helicobacter aurati]